MSDYAEPAAPIFPGTPRIVTPSPKVLELLAVDKILDGLATLRRIAATADKMPRAAHLDGLHRRFDEERMRLRAELTPAMDKEYEEAAHQP